MSQLAAEKSWTIGELLTWTEKYLAQKGCEFPRLDAQVLLAHCLDCQRIELYGERFSQIADEVVRQRYRELIQQRIEGCPVAYLVGKKEFFSLVFEVWPAVLIPRPDTETLVTVCLDLAKKVECPRILDIGTGSGAIAVSLAKHLPLAQVTATDLSPDAVELARRNAARHGVSERIRFLQGDLFQPLPPEEQFDFIVSNPPYIPTGDIPGLAVGVRNYEPHSALDGGPDGFAVFDKLVVESQRFLAPGGVLMIEIGAPQEQRAREKLGAQPLLELAPTVFDMSRHPRVVWARLRDRGKTESQLR